jgi:hypothetical protein
MSIKEILEELPKLIPQEREAVLDWLVRDRLGANEFPERGGHRERRYFSRVS